MCFIVFAYAAHPRYRLVLAANRDEFYDRPTAPAAYWDDAPRVLAGRDLQGGGTWMGITKSGRFAALTNVRDPNAHNPQAPSRGVLVKNFLTGEEAPLAYAGRLALSTERFNGFNLVIGTPREVYYHTNQDDAAVKLSPGVYGISNGKLDTPWPKVERGKAELSGLLQDDRIKPEALLNLLADDKAAPDETLPNTGVGQEWERVLSPIFIETPAYGTRASTVLLVEHSGHVTFIERTIPNPSSGEDPETRRYTFDLEPEVAAR